MIDYLNLYILSNFCFCIDYWIQEYNVLSKTKVCQKANFTSINMAKILNNICSRRQSDSSHPSQGMLPSTPFELQLIRANHIDFQNVKEVDLDGFTKN